MSEHRDAIFKAQHGYCGEEDCLGNATELHHRISNTVTNRKLFPLFIDSPMNLIGLCEYHHKLTGRTGYGIQEDVAMVYESFLKEHSKLPNCAAVGEYDPNGDIIILTCCGTRVDPKGKVQKGTQKNQTGA